MRRNLSRGWIGWHVWWEGYARKKASMRRSLLHLLNRDLRAASARGWRWWRRKRVHAAVTTRRGLHREQQIALGFGGWLHYVSLSHSQEQKTAAMKRAISYFTNRELSRGWSGYGDVGRGLAKLESLRRGMSHLANRELSRGFGGWLEAVMPRDDPMSKAVRFVNRELARGWVGWQTQWAEAARKMASMKKSLVYLLNRELSRGFVAWVEMAEEARFMQKLRKGLSMFTNRGLALGFAGWLHCVSLSHSQERKTAAMKKALHIWSTGTLLADGALVGDVCRSARQA